MCVRISGASEKCRLLVLAGVPRNKVQRKGNSASSTSTTSKHVPHLTNLPDSKMEADHSIKTVQAKGAAISHGGGGKIPFVNSLQFMIPLIINSYPGTPNMCGPRLADGILSQRIGRQTQQLWEQLSSDLSSWPGT